MNNNESTPTPVIFRYYQGELLALFPTLPGTNDPNTCTCYAHVGQHGTADLSITNFGRLAKPIELLSLWDELTHQVGYNLVIVKRATRKHYQIRKNAVNRVI